jgi:branched-chain amino acid transport system permease protein
VSLADVGTLVVALALVLGTQAFLQKTVTGRAMQAVAQNTDSATVLGIDVPRMVFYTFAINAVLACAAALLVTPTYLAKFDMGESLGTKAFFAAIIGGFNNSAARCWAASSSACARTWPRPTSRRPTRTRWRWCCSWP